MSDRDTPRFAPIQLEGGGSQLPQIPWWLHFRAWLAYKAFGHGAQDAETIARRGGFHAGELAGYLCEPPQQGHSALEGARLRSYHDDLQRYSARLTLAGTEPATPNPDGGTEG